MFIEPTPVGTYDGSELQLVSVLVDVLKWDKKAIQVDTEYIGCWVPLSLIYEYSDIPRPGESGDLLIAEWFAIKEGLVEEDG